LRSCTVCSGPAATGDRLPSSLPCATAFWRSIYAIMATRTGRTKWPMASWSRTFAPRSARGIGRAALLGHSMGGKVAMLAALLYPSEIDRLVVVDIAPATNPPTLLAYVRAMRAVDLHGVTRRGEVDARLTGTIPNAAERAFLLQNLVFADGKARWRLNLEAIDHEFPQISGFPELSAGTAYQGPTLFIVGASSNYILPKHEPLIQRLFPQARIVRIEGAGHWVHAEQPQAFLQAIGPFLSDAA